MSEPTGLHLTGAAFPVTITSLLVPSTSSADTTNTRSPSYVRKTDPLFRYSVKQAVPSLKGKEKASAEDEFETVIRTYESPVEGLLCEWCVKEGQVVSNNKRPIVRVLEPCTHAVQLEGLCALCGKDLTGNDWTGFSETSRASIRMAHDAAGLTVSAEEAARLEQETTSRLFKARKLSLIVDLDQTIIHATVDPTVGEWMQDSKNPNYSALQNVGRFQLPSDNGMPTDGCWYYIKMRPGLERFLDTVSTIYEMHVYTMGTRSYANEVCKIIDPEGKIFGTRILSRDESGSMTQKSLKRLFPCDTNMVVVIDDRADVWEYSPNLLKVIPYDFFVGIGDINSAFLPKLNNVPVPTNDSKPPSTDGKAEADSHSVPDQVSTPNPVEAEANALAATKSAEATQTQALSEQVHDRPLEKQQASLDRKRKQRRHSPANSTSSASSSTPSLPATNKLPSRTPSPLFGEKQSQSSAPATDVSIIAPQPLRAAQGAPKFLTMHHDDDSSGTESEDDETTLVAPSSDPPAMTTSEPEKPLEEADESPPTPIEAVLKDDDAELERLLLLLQSVHEQFYTKSDIKIDQADVKDIIPSMKERILDGCSIVFTSVIPLNVDVIKSEVWRLTEQFGALCQHNLSSTTTHVVAGKRGTVKANEAKRKYKDCHIVTTSWLLDSIAFWKRMPESEYLLDPPEGPSQAGTPNSEKNTVTSDTEVDDLANDSMTMSGNLGSIDWGDAFAEVDALMAEGSDEDTDNESVKSATFNDEKKRRRISSEPVEDPTASKTGKDTTGSPLAKRLKIARSRAGKSRLKQSFSGDMPPLESPSKAKNGISRSGSVSGSIAGSTTEGSDDDDFLKEMENEITSGL